MKLNEILLLVEQAEWRPIPEWPKYEVSSGGEVRIAKTKRPVAQWKHRARGNVYLRVTLRDRGQRWNPRVHRLVALAFLPNTNNLPEVDHVDDDTFNNHVDNLEWVTPEENVKRRTQAYHARQSM